MMDHFSSVNCRCISWDDFSEENCHNKLSLVSINVRSLSNKFGELVGLLSSLKTKFTFIILCETWLNETGDVGFEITGYKSTFLYRVGSKEGGIKIYYLENIVVEEIGEYTGCFERFKS